MTLTSKIGFLLGAALTLVLWSLWLHACHLPVVCKAGWPRLIHPSAVSSSVHYGALRDLHQRALRS